MAKPDKVAAVAELKDKFTSSAGAVLTEYRGLSVKALKELRNALGQSASYSVSKNTLTTIAAREAGIDGLDDQLVGPTAIAFIDGDPVVVAKGLRDFSRTNPQLVIKGGVVEGKLLGPDEVRRLADLESRDVLLSRIAGGMQGVLAQAVSLISAPLSQAARLFSALQSAAEENPSLPAGPGGEKAEDVSEPSNADLAAQAGADVATEVPAAPTGVEDAPAPAALGTTDPAPAAETSPASQATPAADEVSTTDAAPAAEVPTTEAAPAAPDTPAVDAADDK